MRRDDEVSCDELAHLVVQFFWNGRKRSSDTRTHTGQSCDTGSHPSLNKKKNTSHSQKVSPLQAAFKRLSVQFSNPLFITLKLLCPTFCDEFCLLMMARLPFPRRAEKMWSYITSALCHNRCITWDFWVNSLFCTIYSCGFHPSFGLRATGTWQAHKIHC